MPNPFSATDYNRFVYVKNNPVAYVDPSGHVCSYIGENDDCPLTAQGDYSENDGDYVWSWYVVDGANTSLGYGDDLGSFDLHAALDALGTVPGIGLFADATNAALYALEGDTVNAAISAAAFIPIAGTAAPTARAAFRSTDEFADVIVIGEDMNRVRTAAKAIGGESYKAPDADNIVEALSANKKWIEDQMDRGATIIDVGPAPGRPSYPNPSSLFYGIEIDAIQQRNYTRYFSGDIL